jgi:excisionase family DNA binding protein
MCEELDMVTVAVAAAELGISPRTVLHRISTKEMRAVQVTPRMYLVPRSEIARWKPIGKRKGGRPRKPRPEAEESRRGV